MHMYKAQRVALTRGHPFRRRDSVLEAARASPLLPRLKDLIGSQVRNFSMNHMLCMSNVEKISLLV
ncbi:MAG: hypothetical protein D6722_16030 [Bacteroidetes bacterium]|nr:MAG: hypothetical protein D6722_16030 [Bacteroidota bacterium]